ncbi:hypothetical protein [Kitasatospora sp. NPDC050463]|uniref:hypothetical protein n=1 Tax=Kitasatospora sp. NPDC050463 TaxID=3155786 RepID=UPI0033E1A6AE
MNDQMSVAVVGLIFAVISIVVPLAGAVVAAVFIRRRGRNARLAMAGCLVAALGPLILGLTVGLGSDAIYRDFGIAASVGAQMAISATFSLTGLGLVLAGALAAPVASMPPVPPPVAGEGEQPVFMPPVADAAGPA